MGTHEQLQLLDISKVIQRVGLSRMTIDRLERAGRFPQRRRVSARAVRWLATEVDEWMRRSGGGDERSAQ